MGSPGLSIRKRRRITNPGSGTHLKCSRSSFRMSSVIVDLPRMISSKDLLPWTSRDHVPFRYRLSLEQETLIPLPADMRDQGVFQADGLFVHRLRSDQSEL